MKRKLFTFLVAFLATLSGAVWGQTTINLSSPQSGTGVSVSGTTITINQPGDYVITGSTTEYRVNITASANVTLKDASIQLGSAITDKPILIESGEVKVNLTIEGENLMSTGQEAGVTVRNGSSLTIQGTGILRAEGHCGIGDADGACGNIAIVSGTVVAKGSAWCIGGAQSATTGNEPTLDMTGDALLVVYDDSDNRDRGIYNIKYWGLENHPDHGIYCNAKAQSGADHLVGSLYDNVTLNSPFPNDDFVVDLNGKTLTLGEGSYAREDQIIDTEGSGILVAYKVNHKTNNADLKDTGLPVLSDNVKDFVMYYGPNTEYRTLDLSAESDFLNAWHSFGWVDTNGDFVSKSSTITISDSYKNHTSDANATWVVKKWSTINVNDGGTLDAPIKLVYPENANVSIQSGSGNLAEYGAKLDGTKVVANESGATALAGSSATITLKASGNNLQDRIIELPFKIGEKSLTSAIIKLKENIVYNGAAINPVSQVLVDDEAIPSDLYSLKYYDAEQGGNELQEVPIDAGTYWVSAVAKGTSYTGETKRQEYVIAPATLKVTAVDDVEWTISSDNPDYSQAEFTLETIYSVDDVKDEVSINTASLTTDVSESYKTTPGIYNVSYSDLVLDGTRSSNYKLNPATASGKLIVKKKGTEEKPIDPNPGDGNEPIIKPNDKGWTWKDNGWTRVYDGVNHLFTAISVTYTDETTTEGTKTEVLSIDKDATVTYSTDEAGQNVVDEIKNQGTYYAHIEITKADFVYSGKVEPIKLVITARSITVTLGGLNAEHIGQSELEANIFVTDWGNVVTGETGKISGAISVAEEAIDGKYQVTFSDLALVDNDNFLKNNYTATFLYETTEIVGGNGEIEIEIPDWKPGEDIKPGESGWTWDEKSFTRVYDGKEHPITSVQIKQGEDWKTVSVSNVTYVPKQPVKDAGLYWATFTVEGKKAVLPLKITEREMKVTFNVPNHIESTDPITITDEYVNYEAQSGNRGLVTNEAPEIESGEFVFEESSIEGKYKVILRNFVLGGNADFKPTNYKLQIWDATQGKYVEYDNTGDDITIIDPEKPEGNPNTPGEGVVVGPDDEGQQPSKNFCNIYVVEESSPYIQFNPSRKVVEAVGQITVDVVIPDEIGIEDVKLTFRRGNGEWETLTIDEETQKYTIKDINTHIYLKAEVDAALLDAEPDENHVYIDLSCTEDGIKLDAEREIVENGEDVLIWAEISKENLNKAIKYEYKVTRLGEWKELKATENAGEFIIWNVTNDVFVRAYLADQTKDPETTEEAAHHVYSDLSVTCKGLYLDADRKMVTDNGTTKVYLTIEPNYNAKNAHYMFRRGIHEAWEELTPSTEANVFVITGIESDIYLKATDAISTGMEDIDGTARIYTKDGSLYIYTPQQDDITVISMTGNVVKRTQQTGLQSYPLNQGIYVVLVGEQVFKVRVK